ncbi:MAG: response regulator transcription factor [Bacteroidales bacterium]|nr:response regulator transcription factor [Bacteroidales bacterium]MBN2820461.1 response regulator transcription factor [Bacteroidales bacterium]
MKFIIVDDNKTFRDSVRFNLEKVHGYEVIGEAANGEEYFKLENWHLADIILMDIEMPKMDGITTVKKALFKNSTLKFIAVTSYRDKVYLNSLIFAGFRACIFKDNFYDEIKNTVAQVMQNSLKFPGDILIENSDVSKNKQKN